MKKTMLFALSALLIAALTLPALTEQSVLDSFNTLSAGSVMNPNAAYLSKTMGGAYDLATLDANTAASLAPELPRLSAITVGDPALYAAANNMSIVQVRNAHYRALANVFHAEIITTPASGSEFRNVHSILSLFLKPAATETDRTERTAIRSGMSQSAAQSIADASCLPADFVL